MSPSWQEPRKPTRTKRRVHWATATRGTPPTLLGAHRTQVYGSKMVAKVLALHTDFLKVHPPAVRCCVRPRTARVRLCLAQVHARAVVLQQSTEAAWEPLRQQQAAEALAAAEAAQKAAAQRLEEEAARRKAAQEAVEREAAAREKARLEAAVREQQRKEAERKASVERQRIAQQKKQRRERAMRRTPRSARCCARIR